ncbi:uncharacterized protein BDZ99DRAFT_527076 [Mytilinidion resinicola]|uniref:C2H2-type domain-containing protein n=1 Tax=Mytilinidion resinicola TaxID=574789 RepID=A0A6A6Y434_9PEZI|nr:uncharacterized protein BDZ99DRAFT_527076 [Mytilinidion resinicola]KAF2802985.1 hypothetical protein BDZ99DRAFT_527076 [Mytilinidion resinicola]
MKYIKNAKSGATGKRIHHCNACNAAIKDSCIGTHVEYCEECGHIFALKHGCSQHPYLDGHNLDKEAAFKNRPKNRVVQLCGFGKKKVEEPKEEKPGPAFDTDWHAPEGKRRFYRRKKNKDGNKEDEAADGKQKASTGPPKQRKKGAKTRKGAQTAAF